MAINKPMRMKRVVTHDNKKPKESSTFLLHSGIALFVYGISMGLFEFATEKIAMTTGFVGIGIAFIAFFIELNHQRKVEYVEIK